MDRFTALVCSVVTECGLVQGGAALATWRQSPAMTTQPGWSQGARGDLHSLVCIAADTETCRYVTWQQVNWILDSWLTDTPSVHMHRLKCRCDIEVYELESCKLTSLSQSRPRHLQISVAWHFPVLLQTWCEVNCSQQVSAVPVCVWTLCTLYTPYITRLSEQSPVCRQYRPFLTSVSRITRLSWILESYNTRLLYARTDLT